MSVATGPQDPEDPDTFARDPRGDELSPETPEADAAEQRADLRPADGDEDASPGSDAEADEADRAEQARPADGDEDDDYR
ncbi:hypothetical protein [Streptomyces sp. NBC_01497]|uniref:hypothetical protein n=1 Tax=Streptomyces sp. NBC_01497 TaxID=2903885 RepID=UPI002E352197|nr:hypothetical protein [Streptomyces sp. NBC_01497]